MAASALLKIEWGLIVLLLLTIIDTDAKTKPLPKECEPLKTAVGCEEKSCDCICRNVYGVTCIVFMEGLVISSTPSKHVDINCSDVKKQQLPHMSLGEISDLQLRDCKLPPNSTRMTVSERIGIKNVQSLSLLYEMEQLPDYLFIEHLKGYGNLRTLSIVSANLRSLPGNIFDEVVNITSLELGGIKIGYKTGIAKLFRLESLTITRTNITRLEDGAFETLVKLQKLIMSDNRLETLSKDNFKGLKALQDLQLNRNKISSIEPDSFVYLENVRRINLEFNDLSSLPEDLFAKSMNMVNISLSDNRVIELPEAIFKGLLQLEKIVLRSNELISLGNNLLKDCRKLKFIDLSYNNIESIPVFAEDLKVLYITNNRLTRIDDRTFENQINLKFVDMSNNRLEFDLKSIKDANLDNSPFQNQMKMETLILGNNSLKNMITGFSFPKGKLKTFDLSYNNISYVDYSYFYLSSAIELDLRNNIINEINIQTYDEKYVPLSSWLNAVTRINFNHNPLNCNCRIYNFVMFLQNLYSVNTIKHFQVIADNLKCNQPEELKDQLVTKINVMDLTCEFKRDDEEKCPEKCRCSTRIADRALIVDCSHQSFESVPKLPVASKLNYSFTIFKVENNRLNELPSIHNSTGYSEVRQIFARGNNISLIIDYQLPENLSSLDISENNLQTLDDSVISKLNTSTTLEKISFSDNPWLCDCTMENLFLLLKYNHEKILNYSSLKCSNGENLSKMTFEDICPKNMQLLITISVVLSLFGVMVGVLIAIYFKYQQEIKIWMYWNNILPFIFNSDVLDTDKKYDAFISYSHKDEDFVVDHLIPELEQRRKFNLCIHKRDWMAGDFIPEQIFRSVSDSRRTIIILSQHYVESVWGTMEFRAAHRSAIEEQVSRVIVIIYGQVDKSTLDPELKSYLDMNTYIEWGDPWFWERLHFALRNIKTKKTKKREHVTISEDNNLELL